MPPKQPKPHPAIEAAKEASHPLNLGFSEYDWLRLKEAKNFSEQFRSASDVARAAIIGYLDNCPNADAIRGLAEMRIIHEAKLEAMRQELHGQSENSQ